MSIIFIESQYPAHKLNEVLETWMGALQKYPQPEGVFTTLVDHAISTEKGVGIKGFSAYLVEPGKYEEAYSYFTKFNTSFFPVEGYTYEFNTWATIEEAMAAIDTPMPDR